MTVTEDTDLNSIIHPDNTIRTHGSVKFDTFSSYDPDRRSLRSRTISLRAALFAKRARLYRNFAYLV